MISRAIPTGKQIYGGLFLSLVIVVIGVIVYSNPCQKYQDHLNTYRRSDWCQAQNITTADKDQGVGVVVVPQHCPAGWQNVPLYNCQDFWNAQDPRLYELCPQVEALVNTKPFVCFYRDDCELSPLYLLSLPNAKYYPACMVGTIIIILGCTFAGAIMLFLWVNCLLDCYVLGCMFAGAIMLFLWVNCLLDCYMNYCWRDATKETRPLLH